MNDLPVPYSHLVPTDSGPPLPPDPRISLDHAIRMIWRRRWRFLLVLGSVTMMGGVFLLVYPPQYTGHATVMVMSRQPDLAATDEVVRAQVQREPDIEGEIQLIVSPMAIKHVVQDLELEQRPEFRDALRHRGSGRLSAFRAGINRWLNRQLGQREDLDASPPAPVAKPTEAIASNIRRSLKVEAIGRSTIVDIAFSARDPMLAAEITNALATNYIANRHIGRMQDAERAAEWLKQRSAELREDLLALERKVDEFRVKNASIDGRDLDMLRKEIETIDAQVTASKVAQQMVTSKLTTLEAMVRLAGPIAALDDNAQTLSTRLREQVTQLRGQLVGALTTSGPQHPVVVKLETQIKKAEDEIAAVSRSKLDSLRVEASAADRQTRSLEQSLQQLRAKYDQSSAENVTLRGLDREASAERAVYDSFLNRYKLTQQVGFDEAQSWIVSSASVPLVPSSPNVPLIAVATLVCALGAALSAVLLAEYRSSRGILSTEQIVPYGIRALGLIPNLGRRARRRRSIVTTMTRRPNARFAESIGALHMALASLVPRNSPSGLVLLFGSSLPFEGKSTTIAALAALIASTGGRVLLIDADLRSPSLHRTFGASASRGLTDCLDPSVDVNDLIQQDPRSGVSLLAAGAFHPRPQEVLRSSRLREAIEARRCSFDFILIDTPPVLTISDARILASIADHCVFLVRWGKTSRKTAGHGLRMLKESGARIVGVAVSRVNVKLLATYDFADSEAYRRPYRQYFSRQTKRLAIPSFKTPIARPLVDGQLAEGDRQNKIHGFAHPILLGIAAAAILVTASSSALLLMPSPTEETSKPRPSARKEMSPAPAQTASPEPPAASPAPPLPSTVAAPPTPVAKPDPVETSALEMTQEVKEAAPASEHLAAAARLSSAEIAALVTRGNELVGLGDLVSARRYYEHAANAGDAQAALRLAATLDPSFVSLAGLRGIQGDPAQALFWYRRARELGEAEAVPRLKTLETRPVTETDTRRR